MKFGGSSLADASCFRAVCNIVQTELGSAQSLVVVASATYGTTNALLEAALLAARGDKSALAHVDQIAARHEQIVQELLTKPTSDLHAQLQTLFASLRECIQGVQLVKEATLRVQDNILSFGERISSLILYFALKEVLPKTCYIEAQQLIKTSAHFGAAHVMSDLTEKNISAALVNLQEVAVVPGFVGSTIAGEITTLGRGGSDYTASLFGAALNSPVIDIFTDVDGVMTCDPKRVPQAFSLPRITYEEAMELSHFGAKVIYPPTIRPALQKHIPIRVRNTFRPELCGTLISDEHPKREYLITGLSSISDIALIQVQGSGLIGVAGMAKRLFSSLAKNEINIILISQASSEHSICIAIAPEVADRAQTAIKEAFREEIASGILEPPQIERELSIVAIVGENMRHSPGITGRLFQALGKNGVNIKAIAQGSSERNTSIVIARHDLTKALLTLHDSFFVSVDKTVRLFLVGPGKVGGALLEQIASHADALKKSNRLELRLLGVASSNRHLIDPNGIALHSWKSRLQTEGQDQSVQGFVESMIAMNLPNCVFIDCTASDVTTPLLAQVLQASISVVAANKKPASAEQYVYEQLQKSAADANVRFFYETNVGAGLPVISTLHSLLQSGDEIIRIEAILSGTLSYLFNSFKAPHSFSDIVKQAHALNYTEPDPRDDLSGTDVARKLLILARETGCRIELSDIQVQSLIPKSCTQAAGVSEFFQCLEQHDAEFKQMLDKAAAEKKVLRYIGSIENGKARVSLQTVGKDHPFYSLQGSDNVISFTTKRYSERPLVVKGPGAGIEVTAAGVFADLVQAATYFG